MFYHQSRDNNFSLQSNISVSRINYIRILVLASIDIILTLPIGIVNIVLVVRDSQSFYGYLPLYPGWTYDHTDWEPESFSPARLEAQGSLVTVQEYFGQWSPPVLAFAIFGLFGVTSEARASYYRVFCTVCGWLGWKPTPPALRARSSLEDIEFGERPVDLEIGCVI